MGERLVTHIVSNPGRVAAALLLTGCAGAIAWNALVLQNVRHPAPLFNAREEALAEEPMQLSPLAAQPLPPARPGDDASEVQALAAHEQPLQLVPPPAETTPPAPAPRAPSRSVIGDLIRSNGVPAPQPQRTQQAAAPAPAQAPARAQTVRDPIAEMIRLGGPVPTPPANVGQTNSGDTVLSGQRALSRLGYRLKVDGEMGPGTRQAIQRFEQDRRLPVTGTFNARTIRELSAASGILVQ